MGFNEALKALCFCIAELCHEAQRRDRNLVLPYAIDATNLLAGGLHMQLYQGREDEWARALAAAAVNMRWLLAWVISRTSIEKKMRLDRRRAAAAASGASSSSRRSVMRGGDQGGGDTVWGSSRGSSSSSRSSHR